MEISDNFLLIELYSLPLILLVAKQEKKCWTRLS